MLADSLDRPRAAADEGDSLSVLDSLGEDDAGIDRACDSATLDAMLTELDDRDQLLVTLYYRRGQTRSQIGESPATRRCTSRGCCAAQWTGSSCRWLPKRQRCAR